MTEDFEATYRDYYREVELHWSWRREKQIIVSPIEFEAIESWFEAEIPLVVILRAIDIFIEAKAKSKRKRHHLLNHLESTVQKVMAEYQLLHVGDDSETDLVASKLRKLSQKLKRVAKALPAAEVLLKASIDALKQIDSKSAVSFETIEETLQQLDRQLLDQMATFLDPEEKQEIRAEAEDLLAEEEDPEFFAKLIDDGMRFHFGLPRLTVLG